MLRLGYRQRQLHHEVALGIGGSLAAAYLIAIATVAQRALVVVSAVAPPPQGRAARHLIAHLGILHRHACIAQCQALHADGVARLVGLLIFVKVHVECGALVLLHTYGLRGVVHLYVEHARQPRLRQCKIYCSHTKLVRLGLFLSHQLVVGIAQLKLHLMLGAHRLLYAVHHLIGHGRRMHRLPWAIDAAIGKYRRTVHGAISIVELIASRSSQHGARLVIVGIGKHAACARYVLGCKEVLTLVVGHAHGGLLVAIALALFYLQVCPLYGLSCCGVHHHVAYLAVRLRLGHGVQVGHVV